MTKRFKYEHPLLLRFCMDCRRVYGCKSDKPGGLINDCYNCDFIYGCCGGVVIDNVDSSSLKERATSGLCKGCAAKRMGNTKRREAVNEDSQEGKD